MFSDGDSMSGHSLTKLLVVQKSNTSLSSKDRFVSNNKLLEISLYDGAKQCKK